MRGKSNTIDNDIGEIRILQVGMSYNFGGIEILCKNLNDNIEDNIIFDFITSYDQKIAFEDQYVENGSKIYRIPTLKTEKENLFNKLYRRYYKFKTSWNFFKNNSHKFEAIHFNMMNLFNVKMIIIAKIFNVKKIIIHSHASGFNSLKLSTKIMHNFGMFISDIIADEFIACSETAANFMFTKRRLKNKDYRIIYNSIPLEKFKFNSDKREKIRTQHNFNNIVVGNVATLSKLKNPILLLEVFKEILLKESEAILVLIGDGQLKERLINYSIKLNIIDNVKFLGVKDNVDEYMQAFDVFVLPSISEGFGNVIIESQASGLPTIVSKEGIPQEVGITNLVSFVSLNETPKFWADHIISKIKQTTRKDNTTELSNKGFDIKSYSRQFESIYRN